MNSLPPGPSDPAPPSLFRSLSRRTAPWMGAGLVLAILSLGLLGGPSSGVLRLILAFAAGALAAVGGLTAADWRRRAGPERDSLLGAVQAFHASLDLESVAEAIEAHICAALPGTDVSIYGRREGDELVLLDYGAESRRAAAGRLLAEQGTALRALLADPHWLPLALPGSGPLLIVPLVAPDQVVGLLALWGRGDGVLAGRDRRRVEALAAPAASALHNALLHGQTDTTLRQRVIELSTVEVIARRMAVSLDFEAVINDLLAAAMSVIDASYGSCVLVISPTQFAVVSTQDAQGARLDTPPALDLQQGIVGRTLRTLAPQVVADTLADPDYLPLIPEMRSELCVPLLREGRAIGVLNFEDRRVGAFQPSQVHFVNMLAEHAAIAIENARLFAERRRQIEALVSLRKLSLQLLAAPDADAVQQAALNRAREITHAASASLYRWTPGRGLHLAARQDSGDPLPPGWDSAGREEAIRRAAETGQASVSPDMDALTAYHAFVPLADFEAWACIPVQRAGQVLGVLEIVFNDSRCYAANELQALDVLAYQTAVAWDNRRLYDEVRTARDQLQAILDSSREGMMLFDRRGRLLRANPAAEIFLGHSLSAYLGRSFWRWARGQTAEALPRLTGYSLRQMRGAARDVLRHPLEGTHRKFTLGQGERARTIDELGLPVLDAQRQAAGWLVIWRDVSEEHNLELLRQELTSMLVHDLRSPLTAIISSLNLLRELGQEHGLESGVFDNVIQVALSSGENLLGMAQSLLDVARLEQHTLALDYESTALEDVVYSAYQSVFSLALGADISLEVELPGDLPLVWVDSDKLQRVLINLLDNALRHTPYGGRITISAAAEEAGRRVVVRVADTGPGIPAEARDRIFDKFAQLDQQVQRGYRGTGLGLAFCKLAVEAHGGQIWVEEGPAGGAVFCLTLLTVKAALPPAPRD